MMPPLATEHYWYQTKLEFGLNPYYVFPDYEIPNPNWWIISPDKIISPETIKKFLHLDLHIDTVALFYCPPNCSPTHAHADYSKNINGLLSSAFNYVIDGFGSKMVWYTPLIKPHKVEIQKSNSIKGKWPKFYLNWEINTEELLEKASYKITGNNLTMIRVDVPHAVFTKNQSRWCISIRFKNTNSLSWKDSIELMKTKNILD